MTMGVRVESSYFVAGIELDEDTGVCVLAAPILKWCLGMHYRDIRPEFKARGFKAQRMGSDGTKRSPTERDRGSVHVNGRRVSPGTAARAFVARTLAIAEKHHGDAAYDWEPDEP